MAEHANSRATWFVTLTYGDGYDNPEAYDLNRDHLAKWRWAMRRQGHEFRFVAVGEYGSDRGRGHWHLILFWKTEPPRVPMGERFLWKAPGKRGRDVDIWPHGFSQCEIPRSTQAAMAYVIGYLDKPAGEKGEFSFSKRPAVGEEYLLEFARIRAREGLALFPRGWPVYQVTGNVKDRGPTRGQLYDYWLDTQSVIFDRMISAYLVEWFKVRPHRVVPWCKWVQAYAEALSADEREELRPSALVQHHAILSRMLKQRRSLGIALEVHATDDEDVALVLDSKADVLEVQHYSDVGDIEWRGVVGGAGDGRRLLLEYQRGALRLPQPPPGLRHRPIRSGRLWTPRDIERGKTENSPKQ